jgi:transposase
MKQKTKQSYRIPLRLDEAGGIDVHKEFFQVAVCRENEIPVERKFGSFTKDLYSMADFFVSESVADVVLESTGVYWKPLYNALTKAGLKVTVANPLQVKQIPMEKTDKKDAKWLAKLLMNDMVKASFIPDEQQESLRAFTRMRSGYTHQLGTVKSRVVKVLESCNFKVRSIVSDISTKTGQNLAHSISEGKTDPEYLQLQCHRSVRQRKGDERVKDALTGRLKRQRRQD